MAKQKRQVQSPLANGLYLLKARELHNLDAGGFAAQLEGAIEAAMKDIIGRPGTQKPRSLNITLVLTPLPDEQGNTVDRVDVSYKVKVAIPDRQGHKTTFLVRQDGTLQGSVLDIEDPEATGLFEDATNPTE